MHPGYSHFLLGLVPIPYLMKTVSKIKKTMREVGLLTAHPGEILGLALPRQTRFAAKDLSQLFLLYLSLTLFLSFYPGNLLPSTAADRLLEQQPFFCP